MKNYFKYLFIVFCFFFIACEGPVGPQGPQGDKGDPGTDAVSIVWKGELDKAPVNAESNWAYFDLTSGNAYIFNSENDEWELLSKRGASGVDGVDGVNGIAIAWQGEYPNKEALIIEKGNPQLNWAYYDKGKEGSYIWDGVLWQLLVKDGETPPTPTWTGDLLIIPPYKTNYLMGEPLDLTGLWVLAVYNDDTLRIIYDYSIRGNTFTAGSTPITVVYNKDTTKRASFNVTVSNELIPTGLPVIYINTQNAAPIISKEDWVRMSVKVVSDNPNYCFETTTGDDHRIRGRGNTSWNYPKKPYRMRLRPSPGKSMFGLTEAENWVLLADWKTSTLMATTVTFELGQRFNGPLFKNNYVYINVVLNGNYQGTYILTEHMRVAPGRVEIDPNTDYLVELDTNWDEDPKFRLQNLKDSGNRGLPVMISSPDYGADITDPRYQFVIDSLNEFDAVLTDPTFPNNNWQDIINIDSFVDFIMINEMVRNNELNHPKSTFMCKIAGEKIRMSHLWDFDWAFGMGENLTISVSTAEGLSRKGFFNTFFNDTTFLVKYKERWNEKYNEIQSMPTFIEETAVYINESYSLNYKRWYEGTRNEFNFETEVNNLKTWWNRRVAYLNTDIANR
jgi:hypothetical protein